MRKSIGSIILVFALLPILASGCAPAIATVPPTLMPSPIPPTFTPEPPATETPIPTSTATPFVPKAIIEIVSQSPLTGGQSALGIDIKRAVELAVEELAGPLQELGYKTEFVAYDDQANIDVGVNNAKDIVAGPQVLCGVGHYNSRLTMGASDIYHVAGLAFISPSSTDPQVTRSGYLEINRLVGRNDGNGAAGAAFAQDQNVESVFVVRSDNDYANEIATAFKSQANRLGIKIVGDSVASIEAGNLEVTANTLMKAKADMVYFSGFADQAGAFFKQARLAGYTGMLMSIDGTPTLIDSSGPLAIEGGGLYYTDTAAPISTYPEAARFIEDFQAEYGVPPQPYAAEAYDAAGICLKAIEQASKAIGGELPSRLQVANAIRALKNYVGITGIYSFNSRGDPTPARYFVYEVVSPDPGNWGQNILIATIESSTP